MTDSRPNRPSADSAQPRITRRTALGALGLSLVDLGSVGTGVAPDPPAGGTYGVVQGDRCLAIEPLTGDLPVEELYDLRIPDLYGGENGAVGADPPFYRSVGTRALQRTRTSITFLYEGPNGLSLVVVHGRVNDTAGGSVSWTLQHLPPAGSWVVKDDYYLAPGSGEQARSNYDRWETFGTTHVIDWTWSAAATDGGVYGPLPGGFAITIDPRFNEAAALWNQYYAGTIETWQVLSGSLETPDRHPLALDQPVVITSGACSTPRGPPDVTFEIGRARGRNVINPMSNGRVVVQVTLPEGIHPRLVDVASMRFGPPHVVEAGGGAHPAHGGHGADGLLVHFPLAQTGFEPGDRRAMLVGRTTDGRSWSATEPIRTVGPDDRSRRSERSDDRGRSDDRDGDDDDPGDRGKRKRSRRDRSRRERDDEGDDDGEDEADTDDEEERDD